jgi:hypothetical protein
VQILISLVSNSPGVFNTVAKTLKTREVRRPLAELASRLGLVRRFIRLFRFFDALSDSYNAFTSLTGPAGKNGTNGTPATLYLEKTLDGLASTFNGLYLLLEATTLVDALGIQELAILGKELEVATKIEAQRCWFLALIFGALSCMLKLSKLQQSTPAKPESEKAAQASVGVGKEGKQGVVAVEGKAKITAQRARLSRKLIACLLDIPLPGSIIGWIPASEGTVGFLMLTTSVLTGFDVWERCGRDVGRV